ncbi:hypothetical protein BK816_02965 [Boudabousia tangfeifanii]|uniref:2-hydroxyhepta-2,4-diene-1,7-dioate isomerase n=1 Tax=Boudabousia tangfeifanii TaxID=1912795 RepID=A0A1D9MMR8_9ACTO|nr:fumarylacetoacetate hydrolase family protein [Boudabousia tangfeifanii]AOZ73440.1 hypothetical protein BK816_02965 [Boudabousia tangfeifanii]
MRVLRFSVGDEIFYGVREENSTRVTALKGDPLFSVPTPNGKVFDLDEVRLLSPVIPRSKVICAADSYASTDNVDFPESPVFFLKPNTAVIGPDDPIVLPKYAESITGEVELAVVVKTMCKNLTPEQVPNIVFGWTIANDVTAHGPGLEGLTAARKGFDTSCPLGPELYVGDFSEVDHLTFSSSVDGTEYQSGTTSEIKGSIAQWVAAASRITTLLPGDIVLTGSVSGAPTLSSGQKMTCQIEPIGELTNPVLSR